MDRTARHGMGPAAEFRRITRRLALASFALGGLLAPAVVLAQGAPGISKNEIKLGAVYPLSGPTRLVTDPYRRGIALAFDKVNDEGGIHGRKIKWLQEDDAYQPARTLAGAKRLVERDQVFMLVGQVGTPTTLAVMPYAEQNKIPFFTLVNPPDPSKRYTFGMTASYGDQMYQVTKYLVEKKGLKRIGFFYQNDDLGEAGRIGLNRALKELGMTLAADVGFERGTSDFSTQVLRLRDAEVDGVIAMAVAPSTGTAVKQALAIGYKPVWGTFSIGGGAAIQDVLGTAIEGLVFTSEVFTQFSDVPAVQEVKRLMEKYNPGIAMEWGVLIGYAQGTIVVETLKALGPNPTRDGVVAELDQRGTWDIGVMAPVSYGPGKRSATNKLGVFEWKDGKSVQVVDWVPVTEQR